MQSRFDGTLDVTYQVELHSLEQKVPKLILQPLLENAIQHGIAQKESQNGKIRVRIFEKEGTLFIEITDTGAGMSPEQLQSICASIKDPTEKIGYGLRNVDQRIQFAFGSTSGLFIRSIPGRGTRVTIACRLRHG